MAGNCKQNWHSRTWRIAAPVIITNVSVPLLGIVDTAVVGRLPGPEFVGAVAVGALIFQLLYHGCNFLRMGTTGLTAQSFGARDGTEVRTWLGRAVVLGGALGLAITILQIPIFAFSAWIIGASDNVTPLAETYFSIRIWAAPFALANFALLGWFFGTQNTKAALITQIYMNGVNVVLDIWFVMGMGFGVAGVAWATVIGETTALGLGLLLAGNQLRRMGGHFDRSQLMRATALIRMFSVNRDLFIRSMCLQASFLMITSTGARIGDATLAANAVLLHFQTFMACALDGFAMSAEALTGEALGARSKRRFRAAAKASGFWAIIFSVLFSLFYLVFGTDIIAMITTEPTVREIAAIYLIWSIIMPMVAVWSYLLDGIFIGCTWTRQMRNSMAFSLVIFFAALFIFLPLFGNHGLWMAMVVMMITRAATLAWMLPGLVRTIPENESAPGENA